MLETLLGNPIGILNCRLEKLFHQGALWTTTMRHNKNLVGIDKRQESSKARVRFTQGESPQETFHAWNAAGSSHFGRNVIAAANGAEICTEWVQ